MARMEPMRVLPMSGQVVLGATGTVTQLPVVDAHRAYLVAHPSNAGVIWVGQESGTVGGENGFPLEASGAILPLEGIGRISALYASPDSADDRLCWIILDETPQYTTP